MEISHSMQGENNSPFTNKALSKVIMVRTKLRNTFKNRSKKNKKSYNMQRNSCVSLFQKSKRDYYNNLNGKNICNNKKFWKAVKPLLSNEIVSNEKTTLVEDEEIIKIDLATANLLNNSFSDNIKSLEIPQYNHIDPIYQNIKDSHCVKVFVLGVTLVRIFPHSVWIQRDTEISFIKKKWHLTKKLNRTQIFQLNL